MPTGPVADLSHWQSSVNFAALAADGVIGVILKATQGTQWVDATFAPRAQQALSAGLLLGAYHFADASAPDAQAAHFLSVAGSIVGPSGPLAIDIEANAIGGTVTVEQGAEIAARVAMDTGRNPLVYISRYGPDLNGTGLPNGVLARCPLWLPNYTAFTNPSLPRGWTTWTQWQYTQTPYDRSRFNGTTEQLRAWWSGALKKGNSL